MTFQAATASIGDWMAGQLPQGVVPVLARPDAAADGQGVYYFPWRVDSPRTRHGPNGLIGMGVARFAVWARSGDPLAACAWVDALFFAALADADWRLSETEPPESFWPDGPRLSLTLARDIAHALPVRTDGIVQEPLVFDVVTALGGGTRERT